MATVADIPPEKSNLGHAKALMVLGLPLVLSHLAQFMIHVTDTVMLGWYNVEALAGMTLAGGLAFVLFIVGSGFSFAVMPMVASAAGTDSDAQVRRVTRMGLWLSIIYGALVMIPMVFAKPILIAIGQNPEVTAQASTYLAIVSLGMIPNLVIMVLKSYLAALERTQVVLWVTVGLALINVAVNYALIFGNWGAPELGIAGAAIASVVVQTMGMVALAIYAALVTPEYAIFKNFHRPDWEAFARVFRLGWPIGLTNLAESALFSASAVMMGWIGTRELAAHGIAIQIVSLIFMIHVGVSQAVTVRVGQAYGKGHETYLRKGAFAALLISFITVVLTVILFLTVPEFLLGLFVDPDDPERPFILEIGVSLLLVASLFQLVDACQVVTLGMLRGVQDTGVPMVIAAVSYWLIGAPAAYVLGIVWGLDGPGIWFGLVIGLFVASVALSYRFWIQTSRL